MYIFQDAEIKYKEIIFHYNISYTFLTCIFMKRSPIRKIEIQYKKQEPELKE